VTVVVRVRRYRCVACRGTLTVAPRGTLQHRHYSAAAIGLALALFGLDGARMAEVRRRVSPWSMVGASAAGRWAALVRWIRAVRRGELFAAVRLAPSGCTLRQIAERAGATLAACAPPTARTRPLAEQAFLGAPAMA
jgi:hypothetical protein